MATFKDLFRAKPRYVTVRPAEQRNERSEESRRRDIPDGLWIKCEQCNTLLFHKDLERNLRVCPRCGHHYRMPARERVEMLLDPGSFQELWAGLAPTDPLHFPGYPDKLAQAREKTGLNDAVVSGTGLLEGFPVVLAAMDFGFIGGSMGSVVGEKVARSIELAAQRRWPLITVSTSGGARMYEGILSLMQMAKTCAALAYTAGERFLFVSVLADPCTAGVMASFASMGDLVLAEPGALVAFAGPRVIEQTVHEKLPPGAHRSEFLLEHGFIDLIVDRRELKRTLARILRFHDIPQAGQEVEPCER